MENSDITCHLSLSGEAFTRVCNKYDSLNTFLRILYFLKRSRAILNSLPGPQVPGQDSGEDGEHGLVAELIDGDDVEMSHIARGYWIAATA